MRRSSNLPPGDVLYEDFMKRYGETTKDLSEEISVPERKIENIIEGRQEIDRDMAHRLSSHYGTTQQYWENLQEKSRDNGNNFGNMVSGSSI